MGRTLEIPRSSTFSNKVTMGFFKLLLSADSPLSSKRFVALVLVGLYIVGTIINAATSGAIESVEPLLLKGLYGALGLLGVNGLETMFKKK